MPNLNVVVANKIATGDGKIVVCDNSDYIVKFTFDAEWDAVDAKTMRVVFTNGEYNEVVFRGSECALPVIQGRNGFEIGVYAGDIHTTVAAWFDVKKSILSNGDQHGEPSEDVYNQIISMINAGMLKGDKGDKGETGETGDCNFATFEIDPETGVLSATYTTENSEIQFAINENNHLEVFIQ